MSLWSPACCLYLEAGAHLVGARFSSPCHSSSSVPSAVTGAKDGAVSTACCWLPPGRMGPQQPPPRLLSDVRLTGSGRSQPFLLLLRAAASCSSSSLSKGAASQTGRTDRDLATSMAESTYNLLCPCTLPPSLSPGSSIDLTAEELSASLACAATRARTIPEAHRSSFEHLIMWHPSRLVHAPAGPRQVKTAQRASPLVLAARSPALLIPYAFPSSRRPPPRAAGLADTAAQHIAAKATPWPSRLPAREVLQPVAARPSDPCSARGVSGNAARAAEGTSAATPLCHPLQQEQLLQAAAATDVGAPDARASGSLPVQAPAGCRGRLGLPMAIAIYQQVVQQQQSCLITPVKSESPHRLSGEVLRDGEGRSKGGEGKGRKEGEKEEHATRRRRRREERRKRHRKEGEGRGVKGRRRISQEKEEEIEKEHAHQGWGRISMKERVGGG